MIGRRTDCRPGRRPGRGSAGVVGDGATASRTAPASPWTMPSMSPRAVAGAPTVPGVG
jgi:hypothetical protein